MKLALVSFAFFALAANAQKCLPDNKPGHYTHGPKHGGSGNPSGPAVSDASSAPFSTATASPNKSPSYPSEPARIPGYPSGPAHSNAPAPVILSSTPASAPSGYPHYPHGGASSAAGPAQTSTSTSAASSASPDVPHYSHGGVSPSSSTASSASSTASIIPSGAPHYSHGGVIAPSSTAGGVSVTVSSVSVTATASSVVQVSSTSTSAAPIATQTSAHPGVLPKPTTNAPHSIRLAFAGSDGMSIGFSSIAKFADVPKIKYGPKGETPSIVVTGASRTYNGTSSWFHYVQPKGLKAFTEYSYVIVGDKTYGGVDSPVYSFRTSRAAGDHTPFTINMLGDMGLENGLPTMAALRANVEHQSSYTPEFDFQVGDMSYADDNIASPDLGTYEEIYDSWQRTLEPVTSKVPYMVFSGNHESRTPVAENSTNSIVDFAAYRARFRMPSEESLSHSDSMWFSFDYGMVHFACLNTETDIFDNAATGYGVPPGSHGNLFQDMLKIQAQKDWLAADLAKVDRKVTPWVIVGGHRPFYTSRYHGLTAFLLDQFEPLFEQFAVDMVLTGHNHFYEREYPVRRGVTTQYGYANLGPRDPPIYIVNGAAGNEENHYAEVLPLQDFTVPSGYLTTDYGYAVMKFINSTALEWTFVKTSPDGINSESAEFEKLVFSRNHDNIPVGGFADPLPFSAVKPLSSTTPAQIAACEAAPASSPHVCGDGFEQAAQWFLATSPKVFSDAVLKINAYTDSNNAMQGSFQLGYNDPKTGKAVGIDSGKPTSIQTAGAVKLVFGTEGLKESVNPLSGACNGAAPTSLILNYDILNQGQKNVSYTCPDIAVPVFFGAATFSTFGTLVV
ncbi:hypothetical protein HKX48_002917 [Thoreauomyces humboldtii]|nr:hypothetical protein HKX48_002917 [Thoreauomyces humboldtii]